MRHSKINVAIIGAGAIGQAIAASLDGYCVVSLWDNRQDVVPNQGELSAVISAADTIFICVPSSAFHEVIKVIKENRKPETVIVSLTKGITDNGEMVQTVLNKTLPEFNYAMLSGPMLAEEMKAGQGAVGVLASSSFAIYQQVQAIFKKEFLKVDYVSDIRSVAYSSVLKNIYAMMIGMLDGLGYGNNIKGYFISKILSELNMVAERLNLDKNVVFGIAGVADFIATAFSPYSMNEQAGRQMALDLLPPKSEGLVSLPFILAELKELNKLNILQLLEAIVINNKDPKKMINAYLYQC